MIIKNTTLDLKNSVLDTEQWQIKKSPLCGNLFEIALSLANVQSRKLVSF